jgi:hypothetical protein
MSIMVLISRHPLSSWRCIVIVADYYCIQKKICTSTSHVQNVQTFVDSCTWVGRVKKHKTQFLQGGGRRYSPKQTKEEHGIRKVVEKPPNDGLKGCSVSLKPWKVKKVTDCTAAFSPLKTQNCKTPKPPAS